MKAFFNSQFGYCSLIWVFHRRMANKYYSSHINSVQYVEYLLTFLDPEIWQLVSIEIRSCNSLTEFKRKIKLWKPITSLCQLFKNYPHKGRLFVIRLIF